MLALNANIGDKEKESFDVVVDVSKA